MAGRHLPRLNTPGRTSFKGPVRQGKDTGITDTITIGEAVFTQRAEISASETSATTMFVLPSDNDGGAVRSDIIQIEVFVDVAFDASTNAVLDFVLGSAAGTALGDIVVTAAGTYTVTPGSALSSWLAVQGQSILALVSGTSSTGSATVLMSYVPR